ncbi:unnamed protein product [Pieris brassicae]|uniref:Uncharacterized protein n=1 Tax=Pieris brassicae TaxID=7116 RepID=A0A9P0TCK4_PIEBR|nr:unnamed protein product [Pieris brassicae]
MAFTHPQQYRECGTQLSTGKPSAPQRAGYTTTSHTSCASTLPQSFRFTVTFYWKPQSRASLWVYRLED